VKICFIAKLNKPYVNKSINFLDKIAEKLDVYDCTTSEAFPKKLLNEEYDIIFSFISSWIIPNKVLKKTRLWNINFHPGPPEYPGTGCFNFAIYDSAEKYGATAHIMEPSVDTGKIIMVKRFPLEKMESVENLTIKTYSALSIMLNELIDYIKINNILPQTEEIWKRKPFKREDLELLSKIDNNMTKNEIEKRVRATYYPGKPAPYINIYGKKFEYNPDR
tara:strand:- start:1490 stop:2149 length:660 start_codon:yes stop_codon:yes gene_type:complete